MLSNVQKLAFIFLIIILISFFKFSSKFGTSFLYLYSESFAFRALNSALLFSFKNK